jgi:hypothetical protein
MYLDESNDVDDPLTALGKPRAEFAVRGWALIRNVILAPLAILAGLTIETVWIVFIHRLHFHIAALGIFLLLLGVMLLVRAYRSRGLRVLVFSEGVLKVRHGDAQAFCWDEIHIFWRKKTEGHWERALKGSLTLIAQRADGKSISFDDALPGLKRLAAILQRETLAHLLPRYQATYDAGSKLDFGKIGVSRRGLAANGDTLLWRDVQEVKWEENQVSVSKKGKWSRWFLGKISDIPNAHVLRALVERAMREAAAARAQPAAGKPS